MNKSTKRFSNPTSGDEGIALPVRDLPDEALRRVVGGISWQNDGGDNTWYSSETDDTFSITTAGELAGLSKLL